MITIPPYFLIVFKLLLPSLPYPHNKTAKTLSVKLLAIDSKAISIDGFEKLIGFSFVK